MIWKNIGLVAVYEAKKSSRTWLFCFFAAIAIVSIIIYQLILQGGKFCHDWNFVALPGSLPLVNAYLFNVLQSFFLIFMMTDIPRQENIGGAEEIMWVRPVENRLLLAGKVMGLFFLFALVNVVVMAGGMVVNIGSLAPFNIGYYLFYALTLNVPTFVFMTGLSLGVIRIVKIRYIAIAILVGFLYVTILYMPYMWHGTWDIFAVGIPNLFSDITGLPEWRVYLLQRGLFFFVGIGLLGLGVPRMKRFANGEYERRKSIGWGLAIIAVGVACAAVIEWGYHRSDKQREAYRKSFDRHWDEYFCRVTHHDICLRQEGERLTMSSKMRVWNPNKERKDSLIIFLNPGLKISELIVNGEKSPFQRDEQVVVIKWSLDSGDSLTLQMDYEGTIDPRVVDLHLQPEEYHNSFRGRMFFPTGRQGVFVEEKFLLLTPACIWYPVTVPPVNPIYPILSQETFTRYRLKVEKPLQKIILSQGVIRHNRDNVSFSPSDVLTGISLCGGNFKHRRLELEDLCISLFSFGDHADMLDYYPIKNSSIHLYLKENLYPSFEMKFNNLDWYDEQTKALYFVETPVSFYTEYSPWKYVTGQVEPGMVFLPERGFSLGLTSFVNTALNENYKPRSGLGIDTRQEDKGRDLCQMLQVAVKCTDYSKESNMDYEKATHPLGIGKGKYIVGSIMTGRLFYNPGILVQSTKYPFINMFLKTMYANKNAMLRNIPLVRISSTSTIVDYIVNRNLLEILMTEKDLGMVRNILYEEEQSLLDHLTMYLPMDTLYSIWKEIFQTRNKEITLDQWAAEIAERSGKDINIQQTIRTWLEARNSQCFTLKDWSYSYQKLPENIGMRVEVAGKVMNRGNEGGIFSVNLQFLPNFYTIKTEVPPENYPVYIRSGEAKEFHFSFEKKNISKCMPLLKLGLATNLPNIIKFGSEWIHEKEITHLSPAVWKDLDTALFNAPSNVYMVDDQDEGFSIKNSKRKPLFQQLFRKENITTFTRFTIGDFWEYSIGEYQGDSIRGAYTKGARDGSSTATWKITLPEAGTYEIKAYVLRYEQVGGFIIVPPSNVVYHYLVEWTNNKEMVNVALDDQFDELQQKGWVSLGKFNFPAGEVSVTLFDRDDERREKVSIMADAVAWIKQ